MKNATRNGVGFRFASVRDVVPAIGRCVLGLFVACGVALAGPVASAEPGGLDGAWRGSGKVAFSSGQSERVTCRANYSRRSEKLYSVNATCATAAGKVTQSASLQKVGNNTFRGSFSNPEHGVTGTMYVVLKGSKQSVRLSSNGGTASLTLTR